jgi:hypothetical protein
MPGMIPGLPGLAAFIGVKFGGYILAGVALKKLQPAITSGALKIATTRTICGLVIGPIVSVAFLGLVDRLSKQNAFNALPGYAPYPLLGVLRIFVWALVIYLYTRRTEISAGRLWTLALAGAVWSCLLDFPGILLALVSPGKIPFC